MKVLSSGIPYELFYNHSIELKNYLTEQTEAATFQESHKNDTGIYNQ
ncbi:hypothetical protein [Bacillus sp. TH007]|nr:hypothetical protein [Bacillus sp. TH007]